jgi:hypothetical protein
MGVSIWYYTSTRILAKYYDYFRLSGLTLQARILILINKLDIKISVADKRNAPR